MSDKKITPAQLRAQADALLAAGKMPTLEHLLDVVAAVRLKYRDDILKARKES